MNLKACGDLSVQPHDISPGDSKDERRRMKEPPEARRHLFHLKRFVPLNCGVGRVQDWEDYVLHQPARPVQHRVERRGETLTTARVAGTPTRLVRSNALLSGPLNIPEPFSRVRIADCELKLERLAAPKANPAMKGPRWQGVVAVHI